MKGFIYLLFCWVFIQANAQTQISGYEYWFNNNFEARVQETITPVELLNLNFNAPTPGLSTGIHVFNIRFWDNQGSYGSTACQLFFKTPESGNVDRQIVEYEYWIDNGLSNSVSVPVQPQNQLGLDGFIDLSAMSAGIHTFNLRFKDNSNMWSVPFVQFFYVSPFTASENREIIAYQYWVDNDLDNAMLIEVAPQQQLAFNQPINLQVLDLGMHSFNIRFKDNSGLWSAITSQFFFKAPEVHDQGNNLITAYRYWFDDNFAEPTSVELDQPVQEFVLLENLDMTRIPKGNYTLHFQFKDRAGLWSLVSSDDFTKNPLPIADFDYELIQYCDSTVVSFVDKSIDADVYLWDFGDGNNSSLAEPNNVYYFGDQYEVSLTITDTPTGLFNTLTKNIPVVINSADNSVAQDGFTLTANAQDATYQWLDCNNGFAPITGQTNRWLMVTANGSYAVEVTQNGCTKVSDCIVVANVNVAQIIDGLEVKIFPNPTNGLINVDLGKQVSNLRITITDSSGRVVGEHKFDSGQQVSFVLDAPPGFYLLNLISSDQLTTKVVIKL